MATTRRTDARGGILGGPVDPGERLAAQLPAVRRRCRAWRSCTGRPGFLGVGREPRRRHRGRARRHRAREAPAQPAGRLRGRRPPRPPRPTRPPARTKRTAPYGRFAGRFADPHRRFAGDSPATAAIRRAIRPYAKRQIARWAGVDLRVAGRSRSGPRPGAARSSAPAPGSPARAASSSRACTTPSSSSGSGVTTCASRASSSNASTAPTTSRPSSATSPRDPGRRLGVLLDHLVSREQGGAPRRGRPRTRTCSSPARPFVDVWAGGASRPRSASRPGRRSRRARRGRTACARRSASTDARRFWRHILDSVHGLEGPRDSPSSSAVEQLIDFVSG